MQSINLHIQNFPAQINLEPNQADQYWDQVGRSTETNNIRISIPNHNQTPKLDIRGYGPILAQHTTFRMDPSNSHSMSKSSPTALRSLIWEGSIPISFVLEPSELPPGSDRGVEAFYTSAPRMSYLSLLVPIVKSNLIGLCLDDNALFTLKEENIWFEHAPSKVALKWHWPIGLIYDTLLASLPASSLGLPLQVTVHLNPVPADKGLLPNAVSVCREAFMSQVSRRSSMRNISNMREIRSAQLITQVKEADFVRWGSTRRVTNLRQREAESLWEGLVEHDFDKFWLVASKLIPIPPSPSSLHSAPMTPAQPTNSSIDRMPDGNGVRNVPMRIYLPDNIPVMQAQSGPVDENGRRVTLGAALADLAPSLFPEPSSTSKRRLARAFIQGVQVPLETELGWLGAVMCCADGWVAVVIHLGR
ncbi:autophagy protein 5 [Puccinia graminis f. sp. tritici]|uniref:Autophagy protein 5 n=1 Tax=Puccinia graminis f. sp. tritici TaxID=56615 RepID=A0A5B0MNM6_PUCGR|nr:autophagy protein 5 [Puccinia graminis f. sp. tritici]